MVVRVLGAIEVRDHADGGWHSPSPQQRRLLAGLLAPAGTARDASHLAEIVWDDNHPARPHRLLASLVSRLRRTIGQHDADTGPILSLERGWMFTAGDHVDSHRFEALLQTARVHRQHERWEQGANTAHDALQLWRGSAFGDVGEHPSLVAETTRLHEHRIETHQLHLSCRLGMGEHGTVIGQLRELLMANPLREPLWGLLMTALYGSGRQADALETYRRLRQRLVDELGIEPSPQLQDLHRRILNQELDVFPGATETSPRQLVRQPLPESATSFVGRDDEASQLTDELRTHRLVTLVGPGGVGKSRLAVRASRAFTAGGTHTGAFVDLGGDGVPSVSRMVANALGVPEATHAPLLDGIRDRIGRQPLLLVLDNCEHHIDQVGELASSLLTWDAHLLLVCTSRLRIGLPGERVLQVRPLALEPMTPEEPSEAAQLFLQRLSPDVHHPRLDQVELVCRRLDGLPLAIELAAARADTIGLDGLVTGLDDRLQLLQSHGAGITRHRSLRAVLDYSHDLLDDTERLALRRLSRLASTFDFEGAGAVIGSDLSRAEALSAVSGLVDKSLMVRLEGADTTRWRMLDTVRSYARHHLDTSGEAETVADRHLAWSLASARRLLDAADAGNGWRARYRDLEPELRSALRAVRRALDDGEPVQPQWLDLAFHFATLQVRVGSHSTAQATYRLAMRMARAADDRAAVARAALEASISGMTFGVSDPARVTWLREAIDLAGDEPTVLRVHLQARLGMELYWLTDRAGALALTLRAVADAEALDDDEAVARALHALHYCTGAPEDATSQVEVLTRVVDHATRADVPDVQLAGLNALTVARLATGDAAGHDAALVGLGDAAERLRNPSYQWYRDVHLIVLALVQGRWDDADTMSARVVAATDVAELVVGLDFAQSISDLRDATMDQRRQRIQRMETMVRRFPGVLVWRCLEVLHELALLNPAPRAATDPPPPPARPEATSHLVVQVRRLAEQVVESSHRNRHWLVEATLLAEAAVELADPTTAELVLEALAPHHDGFAVAGRVGAFRGSLAHPIGLAHLVLGEAEEAVTFLQSAQQAHAAMGAAPFAERSRIWARQAQRRAGRLPEREPHQSDLSSGARGTPD